MRNTILQVNDQFKNILSKDLGAISGLLFDIGLGKVVVEENVQIVIEKEENKRKEIIRKRHKEVQAEIEEENMHTKVQYLLIKIGKSLGAHYSKFRKDIAIFGCPRAKRERNYSTIEKTIPYSERRYQNIIYFVLRTLYELRFYLQVRK